MAVSDRSSGVSTTSGAGCILRDPLTGGVAWLVDVAVFTLCLTSVGILWAQVLARASGAAIGFVGHTFVVFRELDARPANIFAQVSRDTSFHTGSGAPGSGTRSTGGRSAAVWTNWSAGVRVGERI